MAFALGLSACGRLGYETLTVAPEDGGRRDAVAGGGGSAPLVDDAAAIPDVDGGSQGIDAAGGTAGMNMAGMNVAGMNMAGSPDAAVVLDTMKPDAATTPPPNLPDCEERVKIWQAEFSTDPTKADLNADGQPDWSPARGAYASTQLRNGRWEPAGAGLLLDTAPQDDFSSRTLLYVRMQHLALITPGANGLEGALAWLNLDNHKPSRIAVYLRLLRMDKDTQKLELKANGAASPLASFILEEEMVDLAMEANPITQKVRLWIGGVYEGEWSLPRTGGPAFGDAFATVGTFNGSAVFDSVRVERCVE